MQFSRLCYAFYHLSLVNLMPATLGMYSLETALNQSCPNSRGDDVSDGLIQFAAKADETSNEGVLETRQLINREDPKINDLNGILTYEVKVSDAAGNFNTTTVRLLLDFIRYLFHLPFAF